MVSFVGHHHHHHHHHHHIFVVISLLSSSESVRRIFTARWIVDRCGAAPTRARSHNDCSVIYRYPTLTYSHVTNYLSNYLSIYCLTLLSIYLSIKSVNREESRTAPLFFLEPTLAQTFLHLGLLSNASSR